MRRIPSSKALMTFEVAGRHNSFSRAAEELSLTEGAISRQMRRLEDFLGISLFTRIKNRIHLTDEGRLYWEQVRSDLDRIEAHTLGLIAQQTGGGVLELAAIPTFANQWLIPRLPTFHAEHPGITINISERPEPFLFADSPFDAALHYDHPAWAGMLKRPLFSEELVLVCSPTLTDGKPFRTLSEIGKHRLLHKRSRVDGWQNLFAKAGLTSLNPMVGNKYDLFSMIIEAARAGLGVGLVPRLYIEREIDRGELIVPFEIEAIEQKSYCLVYPERKYGSWPLNTFIAWLEKARTRYCIERLKRLPPEKV